MAHLHPTGHHHHPERPERLEILLDALGGATRHGRRASRAEIERVHESAYVESIASLGEETWLDGDTLGGPTSWEAARLAAGCAIEAAAAGGFALVRPPGHHALPGHAMGFCLFGNVAVAAGHARDSLGIDRVAIVDWDVHHGNGTDAMFRGDDSVLVVSLHQWPFYPGSGGPGTSDETTLNIPLAAGSGDAEYLEAFASLVEPTVRAFDPGLVLVSAGFDAHAADPLAGMELTERGFRELARRSAQLGPRLGVVLEGGYNLATLPALVEAAIEGFDAG
jgi:acetoin utilization deacetylase AcuC-like enzyme